MPASHFDVNSMTGWPKFIVRHSTKVFLHVLIYSVETTYGINSVISKLMTFVKNAETGRFLFLMVLILSCFTCS
jgi:hypothetical protein